MARSQGTGPPETRILFAGTQPILMEGIGRILSGLPDLYASKPFHHRLSDHERQVMFMIAEGKTMREIAEDPLLSYKTIATYRARVFVKMNMTRAIILPDTPLVRSRPYRRSNRRGIERSRPPL